jgi:hypothetical protein
MKNIALLSFKLFYGKSYKPSRRLTYWRHVENWIAISQPTAPSTVYGCIGRLAKELQVSFSLFFVSVEYAGGKILHG